MPARAKLSEDWCSHVPNKGEQMVRYGACPAVACESYYSPALSGINRGKRKMQNEDELILSFPEPVESLKVERSDESSKEDRNNWASP